MVAQAEGLVVSRPPHHQSKKGSAFHVR
jgi:hypothetical protein